jgi:two-component system sensor histidine kinase HydH
LETATAATEEESGLLDLEILRPPANSANDALAPLWEGRELFRTQQLALPGGVPVFRAIVPFHSTEGLRLARLDLDAREADFLIRDARRHLLFAVLSSAILVGLSVYSARSMLRQLELEHLAHIGTMSAVLAHEIRNPLGAIKGFAQLAAESASPPQRAMLDPIVREALRLESLVRDLLLYGRPAQPFWSELTAAEVAAAVAAHAPPAPVFVLDAPDVTFSSDPNLLQQALLNLVRNALEAVEGLELKRVRLSVAATPGEIVWRVEDNGPGLRPEIQSRLFQPFQTTKAFGTGLGLAISRKIAHALDGSLSLANRPAGGTVAELRLKRRS